MFITNQNLVGEELALMQQEKGNTCISLIVPTHRFSPERQADHLTLERAVERAREYLRLHYTPEEAQSLTQSLNQLYSKIDFEHNKEGVGLFLSKNVQLIVQFPFPVTEKVVVSDSFEVRDVLLKVNYAQPYYVLHLTEKGARLFSGELKELAEVADKNFPIQYKDEWAYNPPSRGSSLAGEAVLQNFEHDKSWLEKERFHAFLRTVDDLLRDYLIEEVPLIVCGIKKDTAAFLNIMQHTDNLAGVLSGNYDDNNPTQLAERVWPVLKSYMDEKQKDEISEYEEKVGENLAEEGLENVWRAVAEGRGLKLLVERDFKKPGFVGPDEYRLFQYAPTFRHKALADAVDEVIKTTLDKGGKVVFVDNGQLKYHHHIALITRY